MMEDAHHASMSELKCKALKEIATKLRIHSIESTNTAGSGHPTSCCSIAEILSVLFFHTMRYKGKFCVQNKVSQRKKATKTSRHAEIFIDTSKFNSTLDESHLFFQSLSVRNLKPMF